MRFVAEWLNQTAIDRRGCWEGDLYRLATLVSPGWSAPWFNLGLLAKHAHRWEDSMRFNQRAVELNSNSQAAWWNLGVAATALRDWEEARRAWAGFGIEVPGTSGEVRLDPQDACVRLNPGTDGEVVWGTRLDPARLLVLNVPRPESGHRYRDIVLNDGVPEGTRELGGIKVSVFDELQLWEASDYLTYQVELEVPSEAAVPRLLEACRDPDLGVEDCSTIRMTCDECSRGNLAPHVCSNVASPSSRRKFAFGAHEEEELRSALNRWRSEVPGADYGPIQQVFPLKT